MAKCTMMPQKAFLLSAGFGTRFQPQSSFVPKPALPFFNIPQALYPGAALKESGVTEFYYNAHHLPNELEASLIPYFRNKASIESEILLSAGGIANAKNNLKNEENFWVANGDSLIFLEDPNILREAFDFHIKTNSTATMIGVEKNDAALNGLSFNKDFQFTSISKDPASLHFIGVYIFNSSIFDHLEKKPLHIFKDVLLNNFKGKASVFNAGKKIKWYETGNENDFILALLEESKNLIKLKDKSGVYKALELWKQNPSEKIEHFLKYKTWGKNFKPKEDLKNHFLWIPESSSGNFSNLKNCALGENLNFESRHAFQNSVLIHSSQWT